jgi:hypothetical protein
MLITYRNHYSFTIVELNSCVYWERCYLIYIKGKVPETRKEKTMKTQQELNFLASISEESGCCPACAKLQVEGLKVRYDVFANKVSCNTAHPNCHALGLYALNASRDGQLGHSKNDVTGYWTVGY